MGTFGSDSAAQMMAEWRVTWLHQQQVWLQGTWSEDMAKNDCAMRRKGLKHLVEPVVDCLVNLKYCSKFLINGQSPRK